MVKKVSHNHHRCRSFGKGYGEPSHQKVLENRILNVFYKTLNLEPCDPTIHPKRSMLVECFSMPRQRVRFFSKKNNQMGTINLVEASTLTRRKTEGLHMWIVTETKTPQTCNRPTLHNNNTLKRWILI
jgi:hypothetical protein